MDANTTVAVFVDGDAFDWDSDDDREIANIPVSEHINIPTFNPGEASSSGTKSFEKFMKMGFSEKLVARVLQEIGEENEIVIVEALLTHTELESSPEGHQLEASPEGHQLEASPEGQKLEQGPESSPEEQKIEEPDNFSSDYEENLLDDFSDYDIFSDNEDVPTPICGEDNTLTTLMHMGYTTHEASTAIQRCGPDASLAELTDFISAAQMAKESDGNYPLEVNPRPELKKRRIEREMLNKKKQRGERKILTEDDELIRPPNPMIGFGVPTEQFQTIQRNLPEGSLGPPYFYYENVALAPKGVWTTISRFLYDVEPEFVDSKYFCAAARKRGYVHNLPLENRYPLMPLPARTITEALPMTKRWWPAWDTRTKLNCLQTCCASAKLTERIRKALEEFVGVPTESVQRYVLEESRRWNLVWVGRNKVAPLEPDEVEKLLGFPKDHTRGGGISRTDRYKSLGNSFQVDTVAYHLSVLKEMFPNGINMLSLFSGIGGAEVALHRLGIPLKNVVSVEKLEVNQNIMRSWWEQTNQKGTLVHLDDVQRVDSDMLEGLMSKFGGFDLVVGGSPCNNLAGSNRHHRNGLEGKESSLFYDYFRILELVRAIMSDYNRHN